MNLILKGVWNLHRVKILNVIDCFTGKGGLIFILFFVFKKQTSLHQYTSSNFYFVSALLQFTPDRPEVPRRLSCWLFDNNETFCSNHDWSSLLKVTLRMLLQHYSDWLRVFEWVCG